MADEPTIVTKTIALNFGDIEAGAKSVPQVVGIQNELPQAIELKEVKLGGIYKSAFKVNTGSYTFPRLFPPGDSLAFSVTFTPSLVGNIGQKSADVQVLTMDDQVWLEADLIGTAYSSGIYPDIVTVVSEATILPSGYIDSHGRFQPVQDIWTNQICTPFGMVPASRWKTKNMPERLRASGNADLWQLRSLIYEVLKVLSPDLIFVPAWPQHIIGATNYQAYTRATYTSDSPIEEFNDTITWRVIRREPGVLSGKPFSGEAREIKPRIRERGLDHPTDKSKFVDIIGQWHDNIVQFDVWSKTNEEAEALAVWFEDFMTVYTWYWMKYGIENIFFWRRFEDDNILKWSNPLHVRSLQYYVRTEKLMEVHVNRIREIHIKLMETVDRIPEAIDYATGALQERLFKE